ncbi:BTAD domain-containing putative transcriptional regulator [Lentzea aerocolonigenes]|uniref:BTAD domain-containing putative transcriptional regulator n=1 Tax=Lentzea aerocolonigenes TaxID=68170 RepID=UPI0004C321A7|nr:BTAD domain-containing putative transcriptional regulator [Lentzea aerocolonigenes]MCP2248556.1 transcriptional activator domain-containing protein [Lentzea aerocolonigenes]
MTCPDGDPLERLNRLWSQLMLALSRSGRRTEALAAYREVRVILRTELGIDPDPALPLIATSTAELRAATEAEFIDLLRLVQVRSGLTLPEISRRAGQVLPRSQVYSLFKRRKLPTKPEQVRAFVTICGLPEPQVARVMELWATLREQVELAVSGPEDEKPFAILIVRTA